MNRCKEFRRMIIRNFSKDLTEEEEKKLMEHIEECRDCRKEFKMYEEMEGMLRKRPLLEAPEKVIKKVLSLIPEKRGVYEEFYFNWGIGIYILCAAVAWAVAGVTIHSGLGFIYMIVEKVYSMIGELSLIISTPYFIFGVLIYSIIFSVSSLLIAIRVRSLYYYR